MTLPVTGAYALPMQCDVATFHDAFGMPNDAHRPGALPRDRIELRIGLIREEGIVELRQAANSGSIVLVIDALIDTVYVSLGALVEMGQDAGDLLTVHDLVKETPDPHLLLHSAKLGVTRHGSFVAMLEAAFRRKDAVRSVEILQAITRNALITLMNAGYDPQPFFDEIQRANMSKLGADGKPVYSRGVDLDGYPEGKVLKGANYVAPDLEAVFDRHYPTEDRMTDFERGARLAAEAMRMYFLDENEFPMYSITEKELTGFENGAVAGVLHSEDIRRGVVMVSPHSA